MTTEMKTIERIRANYTEKEITKLDELKELDKKVKRPAQIFAYVYGSLSSLVLGTGMCLAMQVIGSGMAGMLLGIVLGIVGLAGCGVNYPIYKKMLEKGKAKYAYEIVELARQISEQ